MDVQWIVNRLLEIADLILFLVPFDQEAWTKSPDSAGKIQIPAQLPEVNSGIPG